MYVITGASDGLGHEVAKLLKSKGHTIVNVSRRECPHADHNFLHNLREGDEIAAAAQEIAKLPEPLEAVINCAGILSEQPLGKITEDEIKGTMATNVKAPILLISNLIERIKKDGTDIVNVSSTTGTRANPDQAVYGASKWAIRGFSANLQLELKGTPCRVISFCPGGMKTKLFQKATGTDNTNEGSWMDPKDIAALMVQILELPKNVEVSEIIINRK